MSLKSASKIHDDGFTTKMTTSTISSTQSIESHECYDEEFTLMGKKPGQITSKKRENCLAIKIAEKYPSRIKDQVIKMVQYYESALESQLKDYHRLVGQNSKVKKENECLKAQNLANQLDPIKRVVIVQKQNRAPLAPVKFQSPNFEKTPERINLRDRIDELEEKVIMRDKKINELNSQIGDLTLKLRKYRKRFESTGIKCD